MKRHFSQEQIIGILKQQESGTPTAEVCREHGISQHLLQVEEQVWRPGDQ